MKLHDLCSGPNESFECSLCVQLADKFCLDCGSLYCDDHGRQLYHNDSHKILGAVELLDSQAIQGLLFEFCPLHKRPLKHFCAHCQACMCTHPSCTSAHLDHLQYAPSLEDTKSWLYGDTIRLRSVLKTKLGRVHSRMKVVQRNEIRAADEQELIREAILTDFNVLTAVLADAKERFLHDLDEAVKKCLEEAEASKNVLGTWIDQFENLGKPMTPEVAAKRVVEFFATSFRCSTAIPEQPSSMEPACHILEGSAASYAGLNGGLPAPGLRYRGIRHHANRVVSGSDHSSVGYSSV